MVNKTIKVKVSAGAKTEKVEELADGTFKIRVTEPPEKGKANSRVLELVAEYFGIPKSNVILLSGHTYREKVIVVEV